MGKKLEAYIVTVETSKTFKYESWRTVNFALKAQRYRK